MLKEKIFFCSCCYLMTISCFLLYCFFLKFLRFGSYHLVLLLLQFYHFVVNSDPLLGTTSYHFSHIHQQSTATPSISNGITHVLTSWSPSLHYQFDIKHQSHINLFGKLVSITALLSLSYIGIYYFTSITVPLSQLLSHFCKFLGVDFLATNE